MKRILACMLIAVLLLTASCAAGGAESYQKYRYTFFGCFDTVIIFTAYAADQAEFETYAKLVESEMTRYHQIFDKYNAYEGVNNLYAVNQEAAEAPVAAEPELMDLLSPCASGAMPTAACSIPLWAPCWICGMTPARTAPHSRMTPPSSRPRST